ERFYKADRGRGEGGVGLGLAIVKHITRVHRGRVQVDSAAGKGSTFRILLPPYSTQTKRTRTAPDPAGRTSGA
ncbi:MAG: ATP-binding protein, partial [Polyangiaceae bacterium]